MPIEFLKKERTIIIRVNEVIIMRIEGNTDNTVRINNSFMLALISPGSSVELMVIPSSEMEIPGAAKATVLSKAKHSRVNIRQITTFFFCIVFSFSDHWY